MTALPTLLPRVEDLATLSDKQLLEIKVLLEKYFTSNGVNVALHNALKEKQTIEFRKKIIKAIKKQIDSVIKLDNIAESFSIMVKQEESDEEKRKRKFFLDWIPFVDAIEGNELAIFSFLVFAGGLGGQSALDKIIKGEVFNLRNKGVKEMLGERVGYLSDALDKTTQNWIYDSIITGRKNGATALQIVKDIRSRLEKVVNARADIITETELINAMSVVEIETYKKNNIKFIKWITSEDEKVCGICMGNEQAGEVRVGEEFPSGQDSPPAHVSCRCFLLPIIPEGYEDVIWTGK